MAAVHKAGEERRLGATPATATPLPSSWKARDPVRPSKARPLRVREKRSEDQGSHSEACVCLGPELKFMFERTSGASEGRGAVRVKARGSAV